MSSQIKLRAVELLDNLRAALSRFSGEAQEVLNAAAIEATHTLEWLIERQRYWRTETLRSQETVRQARAALNACQASSHRSCDSEKEILRKAESRLQMVEEELRKASHWLKLVQEASEDYHRQAKQLSTMLNNDLPRAKVMLKHKADIAHTYFTLQALHNIVTSFGMRRDHIETSNTTNVVLPPTFQDVEIKQLPWRAEHVQSIEDFKKVPYATMVDGLQKLQEVIRPGISKGALGDHFSNLDAQLGLDNETGYRRVYDAFYGDDAIRINKIGDRYEIINGYHRLFVAHDLGIETLPVNLNHVTSSTTNTSIEYREGTHGGPEHRG